MVAIALCIGNHADCGSEIHAVIFQLLNDRNGYFGALQTCEIGDGLLGAGYCNAVNEVD